MHLVATLAGEIESNTRNAFDLVRGVDGGVHRALFTRFERDDFLGLAKIGAAGELAQDQDIETLDMLATEGRGLRQRGIADGGSQVGEEVEFLPEPQQAGFRADRICHLVPFWSADGANRMASAARALPSVSSVRGVPLWSIEAPPISAVSTWN